MRWDDVVSRDALPEDRARRAARFEEALSRRERRRNSAAALDAMDAEARARKLRGRRLQRGP